MGKILNLYISLLNPPFIVGYILLINRTVYKPINGRERFLLFYLCSNPVLSL